MMRNSENHIDLTLLVNVRAATVCMLMMMLAFIACEEQPFDPINRSVDAHFSVYGALDAARDTQWVRVTPVRDSLILGKSPIDAIVKVTNTATQESGTFNAKQFNIIRNGADTTYFWNYWSTFDIKAGNEYRLEIQDSEGNRSYSTVSIPPDYPVPTFDLGRNEDNGNLIGSGIDRIVLADAIYYLTVYNEDGFSTRRVERVSQIERVSITRSEATGLYRVYFDDIPYLAGEFGTSAPYIQLDSAKIYMAAGNDSWPDVRNLTPEELTLPHLVSNVTDGVGLLVGINSLVLPFESCFDENNQLTGCEPLDSDIRF